MKIDVESIKSVAFFVLFICSMLYLGYFFGSCLGKNIEKKRYLDSLKMENLKLEIELKKKQLAP